MKQIIKEVVKCEECPWSRQIHDTVYCNWEMVAGTLHGNPENRADYEDIPANCPMLTQEITIKLRWRNSEKYS